MAGPILELTTETLFHCKSRAACISCVRSLGVGGARLGEHRAWSASGEVPENLVIDRAREFETLFPQESGHYLAVDQLLPRTWPRAGKIEFYRFSLSYRDEGPLALKRLSLTILGGETVAIVGRSRAEHVVRHVHQHERVGLLERDRKWRNIEVDHAFVEQLDGAVAAEHQFG